MKRSAFALALILAVFLLSDPAAAQVNGVAVDSSTGVVLLGSPAGAANCKAATTGAIRYNSTNPGIQYCDGTNWQSVGGMTLISTQTASASASLKWTGLNAYNAYFLTCNGLIPGTNTAVLELFVGEGGTPTWETTANYTITYNYYFNGAGTANVQNAIATTTGWDLMNKSMGTPSTGGDPTGSNFDLYLHNAGSASVHKVANWMMSESGTSAGSTKFFQFSGSSYWNSDTNPVTGIEVLPTTGNIASGTCSLYGMN